MQNLLEVRLAEAPVRSATFNFRQRDIISVWMLIILNTIRNGHSFQAREETLKLEKEVVYFVIRKKLIGNRRVLN